MDVRLLCKVMGVIFIAIAIWGFVTGDRVLFFHVNTAHNAVHALSGIIALACGMASVRAARGFCFIFGTVYGLVAILGFAGVGQVIELLHLNDADNWLHLVLALVFIGAGVLSLPRTPRMTTPPPPVAPT